MMIIDVLKQALEALENSIDIVRHEYENDWRHGLPTRKAQLDGMKEMLDWHEQAIASLRNSIAVYESAPPEAQSEAEKTAFAFGWWKAMESQKANLCTTVKPSNHAGFEQLSGELCTTVSEVDKQERFHVATIGNWGRIEWAEGIFPSVGDKMYSAPPQRQWVGLTDEELPPLAGDNGKYMELQQVKRFYKYIEAKLKQKNGYEQEPSK